MLLTIKGFIDTVTSPEFEKKFLSTLGQNNLKLIVDLKDVDYINSVGWGVFIGGQKGDWTPTGRIPVVFEIFGLLEFDAFQGRFPVSNQLFKKVSKKPPKDRNGYPNPRR
jgi:anti-anti-sigma regulatory factor